MVNRHSIFSALLMVAGLSMAAPACAAQTYGYPAQRGGYGRDIERRAYDIGYRDGLREGERDGRSGRQFSFNRHDEWRDGDDGYRREYGNRDFYRRSFRNGFESGYSEAYNRNGRYQRGTYPSGGVYPAYPSYPGGVIAPRGSYSPAAQNGYRDGVEAGRDDARDRDRFDPFRAKRYRDGDHDYNNRYGSRDAYRQEYRAAFQRGYEDGYRGVRRY